MGKFEEKPIIFIFQNGFRQISLPPLEEGWRNPEVIELTSCDDGCKVTTVLPHEEVVEKMNAFIGRKIMNVHCDSNEISENDRVFGGAKIVHSEENGESIVIDW